MSRKSLCYLLLSGKCERQTGKSDLAGRTKPPAYMNPMESR